MRIILHVARLAPEARNELRQTVDSWNSETFDGVVPNDFQERKEILLAILDQFSVE